MEHDGPHPPPARRVLPAEHGDVHGMRASSLAFEGMVPEPPRSLHPRTSVAKDVTSERLPVSVTVLLPTRNEEEAIGMTLDAIPRDWCEELEILIVDGSSTDRTRELALERGARVHLEPRRGYGRAYRTGFEVAKGDIIVTMDADCTYPAEKIPELVRKLLDEELEFITCDRLTLAEEGAMSGLHGGTWVLPWALFRTDQGFIVGDVGIRRSSSRMNECGPRTMGCRCPRRSRSSHDGTLARPRRLRSRFPTVLGSARRRSIHGVMDGRISDSSMLDDSTSIEPELRGDPALGTLTRRRETFQSRPDIPHGTSDETCHPSMSSISRSMRRARARVKANPSASATTMPPMPIGISLDEVVSLDPPTSIGMVATSV